MSPWATTEPMVKTMGAPVMGFGGQHQEVMFCFHRPEKMRKPLRVCHYAKKFCGDGLVAKATSTVPEAKNRCLILPRNGSVYQQFVIPNVISTVGKLLTVGRCGG